MATETLSYTETEIRSYLPSGWDLGAAGAWDAKKLSWRSTLIDNVDFDWPVAVAASEAASHGRLEALRLAIGKVYRERLGK